MTGDERVVLCGPDGDAAGTMSKRSVHHTDTPLHLAFSCYAFDEQGRVLVTWRAKSKLTWPGVRTNTCCGHPLPGEEMRAAVARRMWHELGLVVERAQVHLLLPRFRYRAVMAETGIVEHEMCPVWRVVVSGGASVVPAADEVDRYTWVPWLDFCETVGDDPSSVSPWCALQVMALWRLGDDPLGWPVADDAELPPAAVA
ncbi:isopentenyl-diphosphate Delta-isomerase [Actinobacteria bacterium YIM 96077]|uniref:Isopentenyl-diphosphate Delta-isomerase n=1 Tax=Phytoactinopolyspora halophila TaxID=1981511 RepID=A0A329QD95_9ACTN|nr:isopentenyl-diphosphate Delta-isomerase [Phytoactinopolyspora halophila]AYY14016.1 isopentenyl-diphosphate Delta-isomerase [Actinobacteria bacterium YIM 96077]RAW10267.1 isopentenyl-diphosphate delta-isomerase [Phytoactinopolyspora halophila]